MAVNPRLVAVSEMTKSAGLITWWRLSGSVSLETLANRWQGDQKLLPNPVSDSVALHRAMRHYEARDVFLDKMPRMTGYAVVHVRHSKPGPLGVPQDPVYETRLKVWIDKQEQLQCTDLSELKPLYARYQECAQRLEAVELSTWLIKMADHYKSVRLRDGGGIYFVPETHVDAWRHVAQLIEHASQSTIYEVPAVRSEKAVEAILAAVVSEATSQVESISKMLGDSDESPLGRRALISRQKACSDILSKVAHYESLLGTRLTDLRGMIKALEGRLVEALLVQDA